MLKTPTHARICTLVVLTLPALGARAQALTEADVVRLAAERAPEVRAAAARAELARGDVAGAGLLPNPSLGWERQEAFDPNAQAQDIVTARVPLDLSGRPGARRAIAEVDAALARADEERARLGAIAAAMSTFYSAIGAQRRAALLVEAQRSLDDAARVMESRREAGEASGYAASRLALEAEMARSQVAVSQASAEASRAALAALLGLEAPPTLDGALDPPPPPPLPELLAAIGARPDAAALDEATSHARRAGDAADWAWLPRLSVEGGYNRVDGPVPGHGYAVGIELEVPLFDHGQGERARAASARRAVDELRAATATRARASVVAAYTRLAALREERARFVAATEEARALLPRAATTGYAEGENTLLELIDARRASVRAADRELALTLAVRLADVELRRASGRLR